MIYDMLKILIVAVIGCLISALIRQYCKEFLLLFQLGFMLVISFLFFDDTFDKIQDFTDIVRSYSLNNEIFNVMFKAAAVCVSAKIGCDICRESNNVLLEGIIELGGRLMIFVLSFPYILNIISIAIEYL